jgi:hypothetical protein
MSDTLIGIVGDGFTLIAADQNAARSIVVFKSDEVRFARVSLSCV